MKTYQVRFRIQANRFEDVLSALATVGPVVIEEVEAEPNGVTPPKALTTVVRKKYTRRNYVNNREGTGLGPATILKVLANGEARTVTLREAYRAVGLAEAGIGSAVAKLKLRGLIESPRNGVWKLKEKVVE